MLFLAAITAFILVPAVVTRALLVIFWIGFFATLIGLGYYTFGNPEAVLHWASQGLNGLWLLAAPLLGGFSLVFLTGVLVGFAP
ncbi:MAG: hypothetical protein EA401_00650 [Planctomycetota bacterium]|nr:MAG: hypothetical protein EA401_00650 [Planctomycetota bacterium]